MKIYLKLGHMTKNTPIEVDSYIKTGNLLHDHYHHEVLTEVKLDNNYLFMEYQGKKIFTNMGVIKTTK